MKKEITLIELSNNISELSNSINERFNRVEAGLGEVKKTCGEIKKTLGVHETLLHSVSEDCQETRNIVDLLHPTNFDHEERISELERSNIRLRLLVDR